MGGKKESSRDDLRGQVKELEQELHLLRARLGELNRGPAADPDAGREPLRSSTLISSHGRLGERLSSQLAVAGSLGQVSEVFGQLSPDIPGLGGIVLEVLKDNGESSIFHCWPEGVGGETGAAEARTAALAALRCRRLRSPQVINDTAQEAEYPREPATAVRSEAAFPLLSGSRLLAVFALESRLPGTFSAQLVAELQLLAFQAATAVERIQLREGLSAEQERRRQAERKLSDAFSNLPGMYYRCANEPSWPLELVSEGCIDLTGYRPLDFVSGKVRYGIDVVAGEDQERVWQEVQAALEQRERFVLRYRILTKDGLQKWVWEKGGGVFDAQGQLEAIEGLILDVTELEAAQESLQLSVAHLEELNEFGRALTEVETIDQLCHVLAATLLVPHDVVNVSIFSKSEQSSALELVLVDGLYAGLEKARIPIPMGKGVIGLCALKREPVVVNDTSKDRSFYEHIEGLILSEAAFPLIASGKLLGVLNIDSAVKNAFPPERQEALGAVAQQVAVVMERIRLLSDLRSELAQRREAEQAQAASEQLISAVVAQSPLGITVRHPDGRLIQANDVWLQFWNVDAEHLEIQMNFSPEVFEDSILSFFGPEHGGRILGVHRDGGYHAVDGFEFHHPRAGHRWMAFKCYSLQGEDGRVERVVAITEDITERRLAEKGLAAARQLMASAFQHSPIGVTVRSHNGRLLFHNTSWVDIWGVDEAELAMQQALDSDATYEVLRGTFGEDAAQQIRELFQHGGSMRINDVRWDRYGDPQDPRWLDVLFFTVQDESGSVVNLVTLTSDVTDKKLSELRLGESEKQLRQIIDLVPHFIFAKGIDGRFILANEAVAEAYGTTVAELIGRRDADFDPEQDEVEHFASDDLEVILSQEPKFIPEEVITDASGRKRHLQTTKIPFHTLVDEAPAVLGVAIDITERKHAEVALLESEARLRQAQRIGHLGSWELDLDSGRLSWSEELYRILGYAPGSIQPSSALLFSHVYPEDRAQLEELSAGALESCSGFELDHRILTAAGELRHVHQQGSCIVDADGTALRFIGTVQDITARKADEQNLVELNRVLRLVSQQAQQLTTIESWAELEEILGRGLVEALDLSNLCIMSMREDDRTLGLVFNYGVFREYTSDDFCIELGQGIMGQCAQTVAPVIVNDTVDYPGFYELVPGAILSEACFPLIASNRLIGVINFDSPHRDFFTPDLVEGLAAIAQQVTVVVERIRLLGSLRAELDQRKIQEQVLRDSEQRLQTVIDTDIDAIIVTDEQGRIESFNRSAERIFGYSEEELQGQPVDILMFAEDIEKHPPQFRGTTTEGRDGSISRSLEVVGRCKDGQAVPLEMIIAEMKLEGERKFLGMLRDVSERKRAEEERLRLEAQIQHAQKLESLGVLAGGIAHDFNNLLVAILGNAGLALLELPPESSARQTVQQIETAAVRAAELTRQMLAYSGKGKFVVQQINLSRAVEEMAHLLHTVISKKASLNFDFVEDLPAIEADVTQVRQVLMNLITNASDAIGENSGVITIRTGTQRVDDSYLKSALISEGVSPGLFAYVEVVDSGCGMDSETVRRIFDPFFSTKFTGRGLGLAAVLGIMRGHKGSIKVYSEPGRGTTFKVLFPASGGRLGGQLDEPEDGVPVRGSGRLLVVDDDANVRTVASNVLRRAGFEVLLADNGEAGLSACREAYPDLRCLLVDLTMPQMGGEELYRALRLEGINVPVVMMSGYSEQEVSTLFKGKGLASFLQKPFRPSDLLKAIQDALILAEQRGNGMPETAELPD